VEGSHHFLAKLISASNEPDVVDSKTHVWAHIAQKGTGSWDFFPWNSVAIGSGPRKRNVVTAGKRENREEQTDDPMDCQQIILSYSCQKAM